MNKHTESKPTTVSETRPVPSGAVPFSASPAGDPGSIRDWANGSVWTNRMLTTLVTGVRGGKWTLDQCLLSSPWVLQPSSCPCKLQSILSEVKPPTGEPYAGDPHVRFGGGSVSHKLTFLPLSIRQLLIHGPAPLTYVAGVCVITFASISCGVRRYKFLAD